MTEAAFQASIIKAAVAAGWTCRHDHDRRDLPEGEPDLHCTHDVHGTVWAELKSATGRPTLAQMQRLSDLTTAGERAYLWCPGCEEQIERALRLRPGALTGRSPFGEKRAGDPVYDAAREYGHQPTAAERIAAAQEREAARRAAVGAR